ncbi:unnamed protein product [Thlaspi arvense]|uniref:Uncharacterized protein n=1 Tax=Thlaspi arvense TaxID=13288 RepID=A0AAU9TAX6_THLAR|nr:unnamed protein product [Thlaspi arvense]
MQTKTIKCSVLRKIYRYEIDTKIFTSRELATTTNNFKKKMVSGAILKSKLESTGQNVAVEMLHLSGVRGDGVSCGSPNA